MSRCSPKSSGIIGARPCACGHVHLQVVDAEGTQLSAALTPAEALMLGQGLVTLAARTLATAAIAGELAAAEPQPATLQ